MIITICDISWTACFSQILISFNKVKLQKEVAKYRLYTNDIENGKKYNTKNNEEVTCMYVKSTLNRKNVNGLRR